MDFEDFRNAKKPTQQELFFSSVSKKEKTEKTEWEWIISETGLDMHSEDKERSVYFNTENEKFFVKRDGKKEEVNIETFLINLGVGASRAFMECPLLKNKVEEFKNKKAKK